MAPTDWIEATGDGIVANQISNLSVLFQISPNEENSITGYRVPAFYP
jgi:hypothetical protein